MDSARHGNRVFIGSGAGEPQSLIEALTKRDDVFDNHAMLHVFNKVFPSVESRMEEGDRLLTMEFDSSSRASARPTSRNTIARIVVPFIVVN